MGWSATRICSHGYFILLSLSTISYFCLLSIALLLLYEMYYWVTTIVSFCTVARFSEDSYRLIARLKRGSFTFALRLKLVKLVKLIATLPLYSPTDVWSPIWGSVCTQGFTPHLLCNYVGRFWFSLVYLVASDSHLFTYFIVQFESWFFHILVKCT